MLDLLAALGHAPERVDSTRPPIVSYSSSLKSVPNVRVEVRDLGHAP